MSSYTILITKRFEKDLEICKKRGLKLSLLYTVIEQLKLNGTLPKQIRFLASRGFTFKTIEKVLNCEVPDEVF